MKDKILPLIKTHFLGILLFLICLYICIANYTPNTFLTGWDTLHSEFNYGIYWERIISGVWQDHQGLGAVATQAHASEIPRIVVLMFLDLFLPTDMIRYSYMFLMLILGPLGVYAFMRNGIFKEKSFWFAEAAGFVGGLFYLLNLGTLQQTYVPLEMFLTHFGLLGWLFLSIVVYLREGGRKKLLFLSLVTLLMSSQAHTATLFYALFLYILVYLAVFTVAHKFSLQIIKRSAVIITATLVVNMFWLLPNLYFAVTHGKEIQESKIHLLFSEEAFLQNKEYGNIKDAAILRSFLFSWGEHVGQGNYGDLLNEWKVHLAKPLVVPIGYAFFSFAVLGVLVAIVKREKALLGIAGMFLAGLFFIFNVNPPLGSVFMWIQENVPLFKEAFRFPFTKFSIGLVFVYAVFASYFLSTSVELLSKVVRKPGILTTAFALSVFGALLYYALPAFKGSLISPSMRVGIPQRYFDMFDYFDRQEEYGRVMNFPLHSFWGWVYHNWDTKTQLGYQGAGFLWFGIKQPLVNREFDRWNLANEQPFMEISTAVYAQDIGTVESLLEKYKIRWLLLDTSVIAPGENQTGLFYPQIDALLASSQKIKLDKDFGNGLQVYKYYPQKDFMIEETLQSYYRAGDVTFKEAVDPIYTQYGDYAGDGIQSYPFVGITNYDESVNKKYLSSDAKNLYFNNLLSDASMQGAFADNLFQYKVWVEAVKTGNIIHFDPLENQLDVGFTYNIGNFPANSSVLSVNDFLAQIVPEQTFEVGTLLLDPGKPVKIEFLSKSQNLLTGVEYLSILENCSLEGEQASYAVEQTLDGFALLASNIDACVTIKLDPYLDASYSFYELDVPHNSKPEKQEVCVFNGRSGLCLNPPLVNGKTYFVSHDQYGSNLRFFARGKKSPVEIRVDYNNVQLYGLKLEGQIEFLSGTSRVGNVSLGKWVFEKDQIFSGNATKLVNYPRICGSGSTHFNDSRVSIIGSFGTPFIRYESRGESLCDSFEFPYFEHASGAVLEIKSRNVEGVPLRVCLTNEYSKRCDIYVSLAKSSDFTTQYYLIPPMGEGKGYTINISNIIFGQSTGINDLEYVALVPFPYNLIKSIHQPLEDGSNLLVYNQAFENGWKALCGLSPCKASHVVVNNWANGWVFKEPYTKQVGIVFLPQMLEYVGFIALTAWFMLLLGPLVLPPYSVDKRTNIG